MILLGPSLWLLWPGAEAAPPRPRRLPEAGAAYVRVDWSDSPLAMRPDRFAHPAGDGFRRETELPPMPAPAVPALAPPPPYLPPVALSATGAVALLPPTLPLPALLATPAAPARPPAATNRPPFQAWLSPALRQARFAFAPPDGLATQAPGRVRLRVALDAAGRVADVLVEESADADAARAWRTALARGTGQTQALGRVEAEWGRE